MREAAAVDEFVDVFIQTNSINEIHLETNFIDESSIFCLAYGLRASRSIKYINLNGNPIGSIGVQTIVKAANENKYFFKDFSANNVGGGIARNQDHLLKLPFSKIENEYKLNLSNPVDRTIFRHLFDLDMKISKLTNNVSQIGQCFNNPRIDNKAWSIPKPDSDGIIELEGLKGILRFKFTLSHLKSGENPLKKEEIETIIKQNVSEKLLQKIDEKDYNKYYKMLESAIVNGSEEDATSIAASIAKEYYLWSSQAIKITSLLKKYESSCIPISSLYLRILDKHLKFNLFSEISVGNLPVLLECLNQILLFSQNNPTGHYNLDLSKLHHR